MESKDFPGSNATFPNKNLNEKSMRAHLSGRIRVTSWNLTDEDIKNIIEHREVFLMEIIPRETEYSHIKLVSENPVPKMHQLQFPELIKPNETKSQKDAKGTQNN